MQTIFKRFEKKYILSAEQFRLLLSAIRPYVREDMYSNYRVDTIYYDTPAYDLIRRSINKPFFKEKYRIRHYENSSLLFYELKKKFDGIVYKRRMTSENPDPQINQEILSFLQEEEVEPQVLIRYDRLAFVDKEEAEVRITFDQHIRFQTQELDFNSELDETLLFEEAQVIMEIKTETAIPFWLAKILSSLAIFPSSCSKYGMIYTKFLRKEAPCLPVF